VLPTALALVAALKGDPDGKSAVSWSFVFELLL